MFARAYDILLKFRGRSRVQDRMIWIGTEGGRDCYALQTYRLCCKWFAPRNRRDDSDVHARAFAASSTCASLPVAPHVPVAHTFARQLVQGNQGEWLDVDYILIDFVGPSMMSWLMTVNHQWTGASSEMLRKSFLSLMLLCHRSHLSNLSWDQELLSGSLCYDVVKRRWFWDDAATLDEQTVRISCAREPDTELRACLCMSCRPTCMPKQMLTLSLSSGKNGCVFIWARQKDRTSMLPALQ